MHTEVKRQEITYYVSDDGKKKSQNRGEIEYYEKSLAAKSLLEFEVLKKFEYDDSGDYQEHRIYKIESEEQFQDLLAAFSKVYNRYVFKPEKYSNIYSEHLKNIFKVKTTCLLDFVYTECIGDSPDELTVEYLDDIISDIQIDCDELAADYQKTNKLLNELKSLK